MLSAKELRVVRKQLVCMDDFMSKTPKHHPLWWCGDLPGYPEEYEPKEWQQENTAVWILWSDYLSELEHANLDEYYMRALELPVAFLLIASIRESE